MPPGASPACPANRCAASTPARAVQDAFYVTSIVFAALDKSAILIECMHEKVAAHWTVGCGVFHGYPISATKRSSHSAGSAACSR
jgi:hypothetical protein